jgi:hypothetical protein
MGLGMPTTALPHVIGRLEGVVGVRLFNRTTRSVALTDPGTPVCHPRRARPGRDQGGDGSRPLAA